VTGKNPDNPKSIERLSIYYKAMREAENTAERLEGQLGLTPGKRGRVGKVTKQRERKARCRRVPRPEDLAGPIRPPRGRKLQSAATWSSASSCDMRPSGT
jgi:hypothetical protein